MTLAIAYKFQLNPRSDADGQAILIATDSRITNQGRGTQRNDGAKLLRLCDRAAAAYSGSVEFGERSLALAAKLVGECNQPNENVAKSTQEAFQKFYRPGMSLSGLVGTVSPIGKADVWMLAPGPGTWITLKRGTQAHYMIGDPKAQKYFEQALKEHWASLQSLGSFGRETVRELAVEMATRISAIFDIAIAEANKQRKASIGRPIQIGLLTRYGWAAIGAQKTDKDMEVWEQLHPEPGEVRARYREPEFRQGRFQASDK